MISWINVSGVAAPQKYAYDDFEPYDLGPIFILDRGVSGVEVKWLPAIFPGTVISASFNYGAQDWETSFNGMLGFIPPGDIQVGDTSLDGTSPVIVTSANYGAQDWETSAIGAIGTPLPSGDIQEGDTFLGPGGPVIVIYDQDVGGTLSFVGDLATRYLYPKFAAAVAFAGSLQKTMFKTFTGSVSFSGDLSKVPNKLPAGSVTFSGDLNRKQKYASGNYGADDFETDTVGTITNISSTINVGDTSLATATTFIAGAFYAAEDFETIATGSISSLGAASIQKGDTSLNATGTFI